MSPEIVSATLELPSAFHGDPGDCLIAATAVAHRLTLCTHDDLLLQFGKQGFFGTIKVKELKEQNAS